MGNHPSTGQSDRTPDPPVAGRHAPRRARSPHPARRFHAAARLCSPPSPGHPASVAVSDARMRPLPDLPPRDVAVSAGKPWLRVLRAREVSVPTPHLLGARERNHRTRMAGQRNMTDNGQFDPGTRRELADFFASKGRPIFDDLERRSAQLLKEIAEQVATCPGELDQEWIGRCQPVVEERRRVIWAIDYLKAISRPASGDP